MATVVRTAPDMRAAQLGGAFGTGLAGRRKAQQQQKALAELQRLFEDEDATAQDVTQAAIRAGMKHADAFRSGQAKEQQLQRSTNEQVMQDLTDRLSGGESPEVAFAGTVSDNPDIGADLLGTLSASPLVRTQQREVDVFDPEGVKARISVPKGVSGDPLEKLIAGHNVNKGGQGFTVKDPTEKLKLEERKAGRLAAADQKEINAKKESAKSLLQENNRPTTPLFLQRGIRYEKDKFKNEQSMGEDFGKPREESFVEWDGSQIERHGFQAARDIFKELSLDGVVSARSKAVAHGKEEALDGRFLDRIGFNTEKVDSKVMINKLKGLGFQEPDVRSIMNGWAARVGITGQSQLDEILKEIEEAY